MGVFVFITLLVLHYGLHERIPWYLWLLSLMFALGSDAIVHKIEDENG